MIGPGGTLDHLKLAGFDRLPIYMDPRAVPPAIPPLTGCVDIVAQPAGANKGAFEIPASVQTGSIGTELVAREGSGQVQAMAPVKRKRKREAALGNQSGKECTTLGSPNRHGLYTKCGPEKIASGTLSATSGRIKVANEAEVAAIAKMWGIHVAAGVQYPMTKASCHLKGFVECDVYKGVAGKLVYIGTSKCTRIGARVTYMPNWCQWPDNHAADNFYTTWGPYACKFYGVD